MMENGLIVALQLHIKLLGKFQLATRQGGFRNKRKGGSIPLVVISAGALPKTREVEGRPILGKQL